MKHTHNFRELKVWQKSRLLVKEIYIISQSFPKEETFGLTSQIKRAAVSIPSNIAEGCGRGTIPQFAQFLDIAHGSACELETQIILAFDLNFIQENDAKKIVRNIHEVQKMIFGFKKLLQKQKASQKI